MVCELIEISRRYCLTSYQRIQAMWIWARHFPKLKFTGLSLSAYLDRLLYRSRIYRPPFEFVYNSIRTFLNGNIGYIGLSAYVRHLQTNATELKFLCLNSSVLRIDCEWKILTDQWMNNFSCFTWFNFTFFSNSSSLKFNFNTSSIPTINGFFLFLSILNKF